MNKKILIIIIVVLVLGAIIFFLVKSIKECQNKEARPEDKSWTTAGGETDMIKLFSPKEEEIIESPLMITGKARGSWFFEADFPVFLVNWDGLIIAETNARAQEDWMTSNYLPFEAKIIFESPVFPEADEEHFSRRGYLILQKDNPSGLSEYDDALEIAIRFK